MKIFLIFILILYSTIYAQISPGDLSLSHQKLEGLKNCTKCHIIGKGLSNNKCLDCHIEIKQRIEAHRGYHSSSEVKSKNCWVCHSEHHGKNFRIVNFDEKNFNHELTGFPLKGKHSNLNCKDCHNKKFQVDKSIKKGKTFLGLVQDCNGCHKDVHFNTAITKCNSCHTTESFKNILYFDHSKTGFDLLGAHKNLSCLMCHQNQAKSPNDETKILFSNIKNSNCTNCHLDIHNGKFGKNCLNCHYFESFSKIIKGNFNHSQTKFPLKGEHNSLSCNKCHKESYKQKIKFENCNDCHTDFHKGQFINYSDCSECHYELGFSPSLFTIEKHQKTKFQLTGSHISVSCNKCHYSNNSWNFKYEKISCESCHTNVHGNELRKEIFQEDFCTSCHNTNSWKQINFNHNQTKFTLSGKHQHLECRKCHYNNIDFNDRWSFKSISSDCLTCHSDNHNSQFAGKQCDNCHSFEDWTPIYFDHNKARFKLEGAHKKISCQSCHKRLLNQEGKYYLNYKTGKLKCSDCH